ncbi:glycosyl transferase family protein [Marinobacter santoriniensis NKSG1]|uniref:Glycosyl transferase family protein n=1 Tax=Marinobacter santoriniensis NKSG1 TaxID=1288826 RepID=M7CS14_9GAMM|nr:glycosyltransferase [Marinobacter santoriniensis]EMP55944.1 glycosyl transferase family protein [Marinobacter santoriniensis NKSG1]
MSTFKLSEFRSMIVPDESEIMRNWDNESESPLVSVVCTTYNHERYIDDAIKGFLLQKTTFPFEIIIHDDCSSDGTLAILLRYKEKFPNIIKLVVQSENQRSKGIRPIPNACATATGEFIAICEGDDFWIDSDKLQRQANILIKNSDVSLCVHNCYRMNSKTGEIELFNKVDLPEFITSRDIILKSWFSPTGSFFLRRSVMINVPLDYADGANGDMLILFEASLAGAVFYDSAARSVYRYLSVSSHSSVSSYSGLINKKMNFYRYAVNRDGSLIVWVFLKIIYYKVMLMIKGGRR